MERVTGIGGIFFRSKDPAALMAWYSANLGIGPSEDPDSTFHVFRWSADPARESGTTTWSIFAADTTYFDPTDADHMVNYRVTNLDRMLEQLRAAGAEVDERVEDLEFGRFGWARDPDGNRFELWQPAEGT